MLEVDLSDDYENAKYISNAKSFSEKWQKKATNFRNEGALFSNLDLDIPYGPSDREKMDIFYPKKGNKVKNIATGCRMGLFYSAQTV